jgi:predicted metal-dependent phosphoesterase TrpH
LIDLHTHTTESDGTLTPQRLIVEAAAAGLRAISITDHDTLSAHRLAHGPAREAGIDLVCGIELSTKFRGRTVHLLGYFLHGQPAESFSAWLGQMRQSRRERNLRMVEKLRGFGMDITIEEVEARGRSIAGRPHFARLMVEKGYVDTIQQAFDDYIDEGAKGYVDRYEPSLEEAVRHVHEAGGIASLAHPVRIPDLTAIPAMRDFDLDAIEAYHSDHDAALTRRLLGMAEHCGYAVTGGSDFHGEVKPRVRLGSVAVPNDVLDRLRERFPEGHRARTRPPV